MQNTTFQSKIMVSMSINQLLEHFTIDYIRKSMGNEFEMKERKGQFKHTQPFNVILLKRDGHISGLEPVLSR